MAIKYTCDRCGKPGAQGVTLRGDPWPVGRTSSGGFVYAAHSPQIDEVDMCGGCVDELRKWLARAPQ
jgi:hypothetical protein